MQKYSNKFLLLIAFCSGMGIMAMEISASRLIAPYFGTSTFVWTNIIGIVLIALSLGYYFGGKYADKHPHLKNLLIPILIAGIIFLIIPWLIKPIANFITVSIYSLSSASILTFIGSFFLTLFLFAFPLFLLGMVSPFIIRLYQSDKSHLGQSAGSIFAVSTIGSILGTFLPTILFIPTVGTRLTITIFAIILVLLAIFGLIRSNFKYLALILVLFPLLSNHTNAIKTSENTIYETESPYQYIQVQELYDQTRYLVFNEGGGIQSVYTPEKYLNNSYYDFFLPLIAFNQDKPQQEIAIIGLAGGTLSRQLHHFFQGQIHIDGVEIDQKVIDIAKEYFDLENTSLTIHNQDGYIFLKYSDKLYDFIVVDAYSQQLYIPWTLTTQEFWESVKNSLFEEGIIAINVNAISEDAELLQAITNTMAKVFDHCYITKVGFSSKSWNYMIIASNKPLDFTNLSSKNSHLPLKNIANHITENIKEIKYDPQKIILTNDKAPVEMMTDRMVYDFVTGEYSE